MVDINETLTNLSDAFSEVLHRQEYLEESLAKKTLELEDIGWIPLNSRVDEEGQGLTLDDLHRMTPKLRDAAAVDPLHVRGAQLRHAYVFGKGINFEGVEGTRAEKAMDDPYNQAALFSVEAYETVNMALFTDGNLFVIRNEKTNLLTIVPVSQIKADVVDEDDPTKVQYFLREWHNGKDVVRRWYPVSRYKKTQVGRGRRGNIQKTINYDQKAVPVAQDAVMYHKVTKRQTGWTYGVPDSLAAAVWAVAYRNYLTDSATLVKALQQFAWAITTATKSGHKDASVKVAQPGGVGGSAVLGGDNRIASVGVPSAQVDFNKGQPLAAMVATSFGVPVIALLSSPGASGGTYGVAASLDTPTIKVMSAVQDSWKLFYTEILQDMGAPEVEVSFPNLNEDETFRTVQSVGLAYADGRIHQDEARDKTVELLDIKKARKSLPKPDAFNAGSDPTDNSNPEPSQGNTGAVPGGVDQGVTADDQHGDDK